MTEPPIQPSPVSDDAGPPPPRREGLPPLPLTAGTGLALLGSALAVLATGFAWGASLFAAEFGPQPGILGWQIPIPSLISPTSTGTAPTVGVVVLALGVLAGALVLVSSIGRWVDLVRRVLGLLILAVAVLFAWRYGQAGGNVDETRSFIASLAGLRVGTYLAAVGGILIMVAGPPARAGRID